ncbi:uncharacterized protein PRCAT00001192001 [Priceomyces carsonii]|uniref:uncharacterized protein n=1 Tax=Priceomyces carsonii TaxID=28549 RepID=UPI002ED931AF|nr:unnamed protein product [Priceomyces carsonii]
MPGDELPMYPTPQQAAYVVGNTPQSSRSYNSNPTGGQNMLYRPLNNAKYSNPQYGQPLMPVVQGNYTSQSHQQHYQAPPPPQVQAHTQQYYPPTQQQYYPQQPVAVAPAPAPTALPAPPLHPSQQYYLLYQNPPQQVHQHQQQLNHNLSSQHRPPVPPQPQVPQARYPLQESPLSQRAPSGQSYNSPQATQPSHHKKPPPMNGQYNSNNKSKDSLPEKVNSKQKLENELRSVFEKVDTSRNGKISAKELSLALLNFDHSRFQDSTVILMIKLFSSSNGSPQNLKYINFDQFVSLWKYLSAYKKLFIQADTNKSGDISFGEFQKILEQIGYKLNVDLVLHLFLRFSYKDADSGFDNGINVGKLKFDAFIELLVYLRKLTDVFKKYDKDLSGVATINFLDFLFEVSNLS